MALTVEGLALPSCWQNCWDRPVVLCFGGREGASHLGEDRYGLVGVTLGLCS